MGRSGTRGRRFDAARWIVLAACVGASFALSPSAGDRAWGAAKRAARSCAAAIAWGPKPLRLDDADEYAALAERFMTQAREESRDAATCLGAAEVALAANALARTNLVGDGFDSTFFDVLALADAWPDEPAWVALAATALRDHRAAIVPSDTVQNRADEALVEALAEAHATHDPDNGAVPLLLALIALDAGRATEAADQLERAGCAVTVDEHQGRRMAAAERVLVAAGADELEAREFLVHKAFSRDGASTGALLKTLSDRLAEASTPEGTGSLALRRAAERVAATTLMRSDARLAQDVALTAGADSLGDGPRRGDERAGSDPQRWSPATAIARPLRGVHDLVFVWALGFALLALAFRSRKPKSVESASIAPETAARRASAPAPVVAAIFAFAAPLGVLVFLAVTRTWPFVRADDFLEVLCTPHPALLALPLASVPFVFGGGTARSGATGGLLAAARRMLWTLAVAYALVFAWTSSAVDATEARRAHALGALMQFDPTAASAE